MSDDSLGTLLVGGSRTGSITPAGNRDYFTVSLTQGTRYTFTVKADPPFAVDLGLSDQDGTNVAIASSVYYAGLYTITELSFTAGYTGTYYLVVAARVGLPVQTGTYTAYAALVGTVVPGTTPTVYPTPVEQPEDPPPLPSQPEYYPYFLAHQPDEEEENIPDEPEFAEGIISGRVTDKLGLPVMATVRARVRGDHSLAGYSTASRVNGEYSIYTEQIGVNHYVTATYNEETVHTKDRVFALRAPNNYNLEKASGVGSYHVLDSGATRDKAVFSADGSKMFLLYISNGASSTTDRNVYEYRLSTPFNVKTAVYVGYATILPPIDPTFYCWHCMAFKPDGTTLFLFSGQNCYLWQYNLAVPWDISTVTYAGRSMGCQLQYQYTRRLTFSPDGTKFHASPLGGYNNAIYPMVQHNLATPWTLPSTLAQPTTRENPAFSYTPEPYYEYITGVNGHLFTPSGDAVIIGNDSGALFCLMRLELSTPWDLAAIISESRVFAPLLDGSYYSYSYGITGGCWHPLAWQVNGSELLMEGRGGKFEVVRLPEPYYLEGAHLEGKRQLQLAYPDYEQTHGYLYISDGPFCFSPDGTKLIIAGAYEASLTLFILNVPFDIESASAPTVVSDFSGSYFPYDVSSVQAKPDGTRLYISAGYYGRVVMQLSLATPWDITTWQHADYYEDRMPGIDDAVLGCGISDDGTTVGIITFAEFVGPGLGYPKDPGVYASELYSDLVSSIALVTYTLTTPWDIRTAVLTGGPVVPPDPLVWVTYVTTAASISADGRWLFILSPNLYNEPVTVFHLATPWDVTTAVYQTARYTTIVDGEYEVPVFTHDGLKCYMNYDGLRLIEYTIPAS